MTGKALYLIDGNSLLYRAYYAIRQLATSQGFPTNAIYGFIQTLRKILHDASPGHLGVVFDVPGPKVRREVYEAYKSHRKPMPEDLVPQVPKLKEVLAALRIPVFENSRYEADDVLATLAREAGRAGFETVIVTTDKDLLQLVDDRTRVWHPGKEMMLDEAGVREIFGAPPKRVVDVLSLMGDASDNVPGVPGVGEKTAKGLIEEFGSLDALLARLDEVRNARVRELLRTNLDKVELSRRLVTVERELDVPFDPGAFARGEPDREALIRLFRELEFSTLLNEYVRPEPKAERAYAAVATEEELKGLAARIRKAKAVSLDTETDNILPTRARLVGMSFALEPGEAFYLPLRHAYMGAPPQIPVDAALEILRPVLESPRIRKIGQNIKYDAIVLRREGIDLQGIDLDAMVLSYLLEPNWGKHSLDRQALAYLGLPSIPYSAVAGKGKAEVTMDRVPVEAVVPYACQDADYALEICRLLWPRVEAEGLVRLYRDVEQPLIEILADMEAAGVKVDEAALRTIGAEMEKDLARLEGEIHALAGLDFNINSPAQLADVLFHKLQLPLSKRTRGTRGLSTSQDVLEELAEFHPVIPKVLEYRQLAKLKSTYADALPALINPATGRIHTCYNQTVASTGRLSSSEPNLQNIPARGEMGKRFRRAFVPERGCGLLAADYSQIELRVLAHLSGDPALCRTFLEDRDIHEETAGQVFGPAGGGGHGERRRRAKIINFSVVYGTSAFSLAKQLGTSNHEAQAFIDRYFATHPKVRDYLEAEVERARLRGYSETLFGRKRPVPELRQADRAGREAGRRIALNTPIQGTAADIMKKAMIDVWRDLRAGGLKARMILQVHDELVFEVPTGERERAEALIRRRMEGVCEFSVPLKAQLGWGRSWADAK